jgi:hypothetical protein
MNINITYNITINPTINQAAETVSEVIAEQPAIDSDEAKIAMIVKRLAYRQRIADKMRSLFGNEAANAFLAGVY